MVKLFRLLVSLPSQTHICESVSTRTVKKLQRGANIAGKSPIYNKMKQQRKLEVALRGTVQHHNVFLID